MRLTEEEILKSLKPEQRQAFQIELAARRRDTGTYLVLWLVLGVLGGHRFYLGEVGQGAGYLLLFATGWTVISAFLLIILWIMDGARYQMRVDDANYVIAASIANRMKHGLDTPTVA